MVRYLPSKPILTGLGLAYLIRKIWGLPFGRINRCGKLVTLPSKPILTRVGLIKKENFGPRFGGIKRCGKLGTYLIKQY
jgi:hypothetical protein